MNKNCVGKKYSEMSYEVCSEKIKEYAKATLMENPLYLDREFARKSKYGTIIAPPTFASVYCNSILERVVRDPELDVKIQRIVHGEQKFKFGEIVKSGDVITTEARIALISYKQNHVSNNYGLLIIKTTSVNQDGDIVCEGVWTVVERGEKTNGNK